MAAPLYGTATECRPCRCALKMRAVSAAESQTRPVSLSFRRNSGKLRTVLAPLARSRTASQAAAVCPLSSDSSPTPLRLAQMRRSQTRLASRTAAAYTLVARFFSARAARSARSLPGSRRIAAARHLRAAAEAAARAAAAGSTSSALSRSHVFFATKVFSGSVRIASCTAE